MNIKKILLGILGKTSLLLLVVSGICIVSMMLLVCADIFHREFFGSSILGVYEIVELLVAVTFTLTLTHTQWLKRHIKMDILQIYLGEKRSYLLVEAITLLIVFGIMALLAWTTWFNAIDAFIRREYRYGFIPFYTYPGKLIMAFSLSVFCLVTLTQTIKEFTRFFGDKAGKLEKDI